MSMRVACLGLLTAILVGSSAQAQVNKDKPYAFFSNQSTIPAQGTPPREAEVANLYLRPNVEQQAYVFVHNPSDGDRKLTVRLSYGEKDAQAALAGAELGRATGVLVPKEQTVRVKLTAPGAPPAAAPAVPPPPAPAADDKTKPAAPAIPAGIKLSKTQLILEVIDEEEQRAEDKLQNRVPVELDVQSPIELLEVPQPILVPGSEQLIIPLEFKKNIPLFTDKPAKVTLDLRPDLNPDLDPETLNEGTYEANLPVTGKVQLVAEGVKFRAGAERNAIIAINVDGFDRAFLYKTNFKGTPNPVTEPFVNIHAKETRLIPGKPAHLQLEFNNVQNLPYAELRIDRRNRAAFRDESADVVSRFEGLRRKEVYLNVGGPEDAITLNAILNDWTYDFPTSNVYGIRTFHLRAANAAQNPTEFRPTLAEVTQLRDFNVSNERAIVLDRTPPQVKFDSFPDKLIAGTKVQIPITATEDLTSFSQVLFYIGDAPAKDAKVIPGKLIRQTVLADSAIGVRSQQFAGELTLPNEPGPIQIGVKVFNEVGLGSRDDEGVSFLLVDVLPVPPKEPEKTTGTITGRVMQGSRAQPGLTVNLWDSKGQDVIKSTKSNGNGEFKFEDVPPGSYIVTSIKKQDDAKGLDRVSVEKGKTSTASINVLR